MSDRTRILMVASSNGDYGGMEGFTFRLARTVKDTDDLDVLVLLKKMPDFELTERLESMLSRESFESKLIPGRSLDLLRQIRAADVVHSQTQSIDFALAARAFRKPHVMTFHTTRENAPRAREWVASRLPDRRLYNSEFTWDTWEPRRRRPGSSKLPYMPDLPSGTLDPGARRGFVFMSRWVPDKGLDVLVEAYDRAELDREAWPLTLIGDGPLRPAIEREVMDRGLATVRMPGFLSGEAKAAAIRGARWMVVPSDWNEPLGFAALEARHVGVPCIVTRDGGLPEAAGPLCLNCAPGDPSALARLLEFAAAMDERTYEWLSGATQADLLAGLESPEAYLDLYRELAAG